MCRPTASAAVHPKIRSAPRFQEVMTPSRVLLTIASSDESMIAARRDRSSSRRRRSVMSRATLEAPTMRPALFRTGDTVNEMSRSRPSFVIRTVSK